MVMIDWIEGRSIEQRREIVKKITDIIAEVGNADPQSIKICFTDHSKEQYAVAGKLLCDS